MNLLISGHLGYLGSVLARKALDRGHSVTGVDLGFYSTPLVEKHIAGAETIRADVCDVTADMLEGTDFCFHCSAISNDPSAEMSEEATYRANVEGTEAVANACAEAGTRLILASTASIYGIAEWCLSTEDDEPNPISIYARSKVAAERVVRERAQRDKLQCVILRQATLFGWSPRMRLDLVVNALVASALQSRKIVAHGSGECFRPLCEVGDAADCWLRIAEIADDDFFLEWGGPDYDWCPTFNIVHRNYRISELVLWVGDILREAGVPCEVVIDRKTAADRRDYAMSDERALSIGLTCPTGVARAVHDILAHVESGDLTDLSHPRYRNHAWLTLLAEARDLIIGLDGAG